MEHFNKYKGVIPAFYACYDEAGNLSRQRIRTYAESLITKGVTGLYVGGSSGECIYQTVDERKEVLEQVMTVAKGRITVIAHVAAPSTRESILLAQHASSCGVDAIAAIPPIYFHLPESAIANYWQAMIDVADCDFIIYNIPQTTGHYLSTDLFLKMLDNPKVIGVKNSSEPVLDITKFKLAAKTMNRPVIVFNGPDEQFLSGLMAGADAGIGGTYGVMPELFVKLYQLTMSGNLTAAKQLQATITDIILQLLNSSGSLYSVIKAILAQQGMPIGEVRGPLPAISSVDKPIVDHCRQLIDQAIASNPL